MNPEQIYAFECSVSDAWTPTIVHAATLGEAKSNYLRQVQDPWPSIKYTNIRCRKLGPPITSEGFKRTAEYRGFPDLRIGDEIIYGRGNRGWIVGTNLSANFNVRIPGGCIVSVHPADVIVIKKGEK